MRARHWPVLYRPIEQAHVYHAAVTMYVRLEKESPIALSAVQNAVHGATGQRVPPITSETGMLQKKLLTIQSSAVALNAFAVFGLLLASMGLYGTTAHAMTQRTREIGIRIALGAERARVMLELGKRSAIVAVLGILFGVAAATAAMRVVRVMVAETSATDAGLFVAAAVVMLVVAGVATVVPVRRAAGVDPVQALRSE